MSIFTAPRDLAKSISIALSPDPRLKNPLLYLLNHPLLAINLQYSTESVDLIFPSIVISSSIALSIGWFPSQLNISRICTKVEAFPFISPIGSYTFLKYYLIVITKIGSYHHHQNLHLLSY